MKRRAKKGPIIVTLLLLIMLIFGSLYAFKNVFTKEKENEKPTELDKDKPKEEKKSLTFTLAGNVLVNSNMWYDTLAENKTYNFKYVFEDLKSIMKRSHINFYSQQSIIGGKDLGLSAYYNYNSPTDVGDAMTDIGFNMVSLANYHAFDKKIKGIENSIKYWTDKNVAYSGTSISEETRNKNNIINKNGVKVGLLSYTMGTDEVYKGTYEINIYSDEQAKKDINELKDKVDIVMVSIDWGNVGKIEVTDKQKQTATYLSELGADIIVGNTGYSIQTIEKINNTIVFYSLGNLLSGHTMVDSRISAVIDFKVNLTEKEDERKIEFKNIKVLLTYAYNNDNTDYKVIPFNKLDKELKNYKTYYDKYTEILTKNEKEVTLYKIGDENGNTKQES